MENRLSVDLKKVPGFAEDLKEEIDVLERELDDLQQQLYKVQISLKIKLIDREISRLEFKKLKLKKHFNELD